MSDETDESEAQEPAVEPNWLDRMRNRDLTRGSLYKSLMVLALPMVATSFFGGVFFQMGDLKLISGLGTSAMTAIIVTNQTLRQFFIMAVMGASFGTQGMIARAVGTGDREGAEHTAGQVLILGLGLSTFMAFLGIFFAREMLSSMRVSQDVIDVGVPYVQTVFVLNFGMIFVFLSNGILTGAGDTTTPFIVAIIQALVGLFAEYCLIYGNFGAPELGIRGAAVGLVCGHAASVVLISRALFGGRTRIHLRRRHLRPDLDAIRNIVKHSWPPALQMMSTFLVTIYFVRMMGGFGETAQAAYSIGLRLGMVAPMVAFPLAGAAATLVGQNLGSGNIKRAWKSLWVGLSVHALLMISMSIALFLYRVPLLEAFSQDPEVIRLGDEMLFYQSISFIMFAFYFVFFRALQGAGDVLFSMVLSIANSLFNVALGTYLATYKGYGPTGIFISGLISSMVVTTLTAAWIATGRWTRRHDKYRAAG